MATVAMTLPMKDIEAVIVHETSSASPGLNINNELIAAKIEELFVKGLDAALDLLDFGVAEHRLSIARSILAVAAKMVGGESSTQTREIRLQLDNLFADMRAIDVTSHAAPPEPYDPNEIPGTGAT